MASQDNTPFLDSTPVEVVIKSLQSQIKELQNLVKGQVPENTTSPAAPAQDLSEELAKLRTQNAKAEYRIKFLLKALDERDAANKKH
ncbi:hypothetical protein CLU79DRAFT_753884 [Phycomyces nitens]|nr:hypothetical protein CLU79DRAFT_753884 [Phycomyces nitens]